jgi:hypothetical protein
LTDDYNFLKPELIYFLTAGVICSLGELTCDTLPEPRLGLTRTLVISAMMVSRALRLEASNRFVFA